MGDTWVTKAMYDMVRTYAVSDKKADAAIESAAKRVGNVARVIGSAAAKVAAIKQASDSFHRGLAIEHNRVQSHVTGARVLAGAAERSGAVIAAGVKKYEADLAAAKLTPRGRAYTAIDRALLLQLLEFDIKSLKELATTKLPRGRPGTADVISPSNWALSHVHPVQLWATEIQSSLRRLSAVDGVDAAVSSVLRQESKRAHERTILAALTPEAVPSQVGDSIDSYLIYAENRVVRHILEKMVRRYSPSSAPFELSRALGDLTRELALNNMKSITRVRELTELYKATHNRQPLTAYYAELYSRINSSK